MLSQFKMPLEDVIAAIWRMDESVLSLENLKALRYIAPKEDEVSQSAEDNECFPRSASKC
jgi:hypothetical protein